MFNDLTRRADRELLHAGAPPRPSPGEREWNPLVVREGRARWRGARAFWLALGYAGFLGAVSWWSYASSHHLRPTDGTSPVDALGVAAQLGHDLFKVLCFCQVAAWLLLGPLLTAASISGERRKGLLDGLLLSRLSSEQIVRGKWASALSLIVLLQLAGLPVLAVCFVLGGVSPGEFVGAYAIQLAAAGCGAGCGIASSAGSRNNSDAASGAIGFMIMWLAATCVGIPFIPSGSGYTPLLNEGLHLIASANPLFALSMLLSPPRAGGMFPPGLWSAFFALGCGWLLSALSMGLLTAWLLRFASRAVRLSPERLDDPQPAPAPREWASSASLTPTYLDAPRSTTARPPGRWEVPLLNQVVFGNAILRREMSLMWRWPILSEREKSCVFFLGLIAALTAATGAALILDSPANAEGVWWTTLAMFAGAGAVGCAARPASSIASERDGGMWQGLGLTRLSPLQIAAAKIAAPIVAAVGYGIVAWPFLITSAPRGGVGFGVAASSVTLMLLVWAQCAAWSTLVGARARVPSSALGWGLGGPALAWVGVPALLSLFDSRLLDASAHAAWVLHPLAGVGTSVSATAVVVQAGIAAILFVLAWRAVKTSQRAR